MSDTLHEKKRFHIMSAVSYDMEAFHMQKVQGLHKMEAFLMKENPKDETLVYDLRRLSKV
eukprot:c23285_g6_i1 orf=161-340(+)